MSTEYRRGIPSVAHVEAATRLGMEWEEVRPHRNPRRWRFQIRGSELWCDFWTNVAGWDRDLEPLSSGRIADRTDVEHYTFRPIRPDGTPVDWEVLDQEVARAGQQAQPATVTATASAAPTQPQGFRADLWRRICRHFIGAETDTYNQVTFDDIVSLNDTACHFTQFFWDWRDVPGASAAQTDILARWTVYQELKPLYDLVDGAQGEAVMPADVVTEWARQARGGENIRPDWELVRTTEGLLGRTTNQQGGIISWSDAENWLGQPLRNFAAVLDAVAERRVAERMRGQAQAPIVTSAQPEPRRFADVRPDRHGWRWWRQTGRDSTDLGQRFETLDGRCRWRSAHADAWFVPDTANPQMLRYTVIPTDEQGNPVSWEAAGFTAEAMRFAQETVQRAANDATPSRSVSDIIVDPATGMVRSAHTVRIESPTPPRPGQFSNDLTASAPITAESFARVLQQMDRSAMVAATRFAETPQTRALVEAQRAREEAETRARVLQQVRNGVEQELSDNRVIIGVDTLKQQPLPRFTTDELDDVDHSRTTKLDEVTLRRGKLPTVEQIAKYREVRARRTGGTVADALKESRIDCEVAQYVLERWAGGLGDEEAFRLIHVATCYGYRDQPALFKNSDIDRRIGVALANRLALDTSEKPNPTVQRERQEAEERRQRLAELRQRLAAERAAQPTEEAPTTTSRFDLIEPDPQADPAASIRAWEARQAAAKVRPVLAPPRSVKPVAAQHRPAIEVVDAEADGLSRGDIVAALVGRAFNGGC